MDANGYVPLIVAIGAVVTSVLAYIRGRKADDAKTESTQATTAVQGFGTLTKFLQDEITRLTADVAQCRLNENVARKQADEDRREIYLLRQEVRRLGGNV